MQVDGETQNVAEAQAMLWGFWESGPVGFGIYVGAFVLGVGAEGVGHGGLCELMGVSGA